LFVHASFNMTPDWPVASEDSLFPVRLEGQPQKFERSLRHANKPASFRRASLAPWFRNGRVVASLTDLQ
jgi:hypothetical protein